MTDLTGYTVARALAAAVSLETTNKQLPSKAAYGLDSRDCRHQDIRRPIQTLYKAINGVLRIGNFWSRIRNLKYRARCSSCNAPIGRITLALRMASVGKRNLVSLGSVAVTIDVLKFKTKENAGGAR